MVGHWCLMKLLSEIFERYEPYDFQVGKNFSLITLALMVRSGLGVWFRNQKEDQKHKDR